MMDKARKIMKFRKGAAGGESLGTITKLLLMIGFIGIAGLIIAKFFGTTFPQLNVFTTFMGGL